MILGKGIFPLLVHSKLFLVSHGTFVVVLSKIARGDKLSVSVTTWIRWPFSSATNCQKFIFQ